MQHSFHTSNRPVEKGLRTLLQHSLFLCHKQARHTERPPYNSWDIAAKAHCTPHLCSSSGSHKSKQDNRQQTHKKMDTAFAQPDTRFPGMWLLQGNYKVSPNWCSRWLLCDRLALALLHTSSGLLHIGCCTKMRESYTVHPGTTPASHNLTPHNHYHSGIVWGN
jgi:hypothetical protein